MSDHRYCPRIETNSSLKYRLQEGKEEFYGTALNCNYGGLYIQTEYSPEKGSQIVIEFAFDNEPTPVQAIAERVWINKQTPKGMSVKLHDFVKDDVRNFSEWLQKMCIVLGYSDECDSCTHLK